MLVANRADIAVTDATLTKMRTATIGSSIANCVLCHSFFPALPNKKNANRAAVEQGPPAITSALLKTKQHAPDQPGRVALIYDKSVAGNNRARATEFVVEANGDHIDILVDLVERIGEGAAH